MPASRKAWRVLAPPASKAGAHRAGIRRLVPDLALCLTVVTLFFCLILFNAPQKLFRDSDTGWHIVTGEKIVDTMQLPRTDPYSFSRAWRPWVACQRGADCFIRGWFRVAGRIGLVWIFVLAV